MTNLFFTTEQRTPGEPKKRGGAVPSATSDARSISKVKLNRVVMNSFCAFVAVALLSGCATSGKRYRIPKNQQPEVVNMETTGYCKCGKCCGWKRNWKFEPVVAYGPKKGEPKAVGVTAAGTKADWGTIAADTRYYPFGTIMYIPDYGWGRVEDIGGAIKGMHIDLFFPSHKKALHWGRQRKQVQVWKPN